MNTHGIIFAHQTGWLESVVRSESRLSTLSGQGDEGGVDVCETLQLSSYGRFPFGDPLVPPPWMISYVDRDYKRSMRTSSLEAPWEHLGGCQQSGKPGCLCLGLHMMLIPSVQMPRAHIALQTSHAIPVLGHSRQSLVP